ncbi:hypothetical protein [Sulfitobacter sp. R18_1]|uniref:hypothetical protein n=1 Tax=Sulfitobacter sp. R18_1 TaxID=2821104 RepID=UPI001AD9992C|nr:hypothetical protein [Sulfitobacter sp. R18_1]MBO9427878.1 hypothetical protein [Sulfitobacter sp. R18_1]
MSTSEPKERIVAAAIQCEGVTVSLPQPARHAQIMWCAHSLMEEDRVHNAVQGFLTSEGRFVNRIEAKFIAHRAGQKIIRENPHEIEAFSEDFW